MGLKCRERLQLDGGSRGGAWMTDSVGCLTDQAVTQRSPFRSGQGPECIASLKNGLPQNGEDGESDE